MPFIQRLDEITVNQIAAGEVIENAASVIKELIDNALDAEATEIVIEIKEAGRQFIRVTDNGKGMDQADAFLAWQRHTTSKIQAFQDLEKIKTMGFRGEALASISAISKIRMTTRTAFNEKGLFLIFENNEVQSYTEIPAPLGTSIEVNDLFFNVPARKKFLKAPSYDIQEIQKTITALALAYPKVAFSFFSDHARLLNAPKPTVTNEMEILKQRIAAVLSFDLEKEFVPIEWHNENYQLKGFVSKPSLHRAQRSYQLLSVNQRPITNWLISQAVLLGYAKLLPERRFPLYVLQLTLDTESIDINVHPQKKEVRFRYEIALRDFFIKGISALWQKPSLELESPFSSLNGELPFQISNLSAPEIKNDFLNSQPLSTYQAPELFTQPKIFEKQTVDFWKPEPALALDIQVIGSLINYIILNKTPTSEGEGLCLMDQRRALARIHYEKIINSPVEASSQQLLAPICFNTSADEEGLINQNKESLKNLGFGLRSFGLHTYLIEEIPSFLSLSDVEKNLRQILYDLSINSDTNWQKNRMHQVALIASKYACPLLKRFSIEEAAHILKQLLSCQQPYFAPQGQAIFAVIPLNEIGKYFR